MTLYLNAQHRNTVCVLCNLNTKNFYYITYIQINDIFVFNICEQVSNNIITGKYTRVTLPYYIICTTFYYLVSLGNARTTKC